MILRLSIWREGLAWQQGGSAEGLSLPADDAEACAKVASFLR